MGDDTQKKAFAAGMEDTGRYIHLQSSVFSGAVAPLGRSYRFRSLAVSFFRAMESGFAVDLADVAHAKPSELDLGTLPVST